MRGWVEREGVDREGGLRGGYMSHMMTGWIVRVNSA